MASWEELKSYIKASYATNEISPRALGVALDTGAGRSQMVFVSSLLDRDGAEWASIDSAIGRLDEVNLNAALRAVAGLVCGGIAHLHVGGIDFAAIRHVVPLTNLDTNEFDEPLKHVTQSADDFERALSGGRDIL